MKQLLPQPSVPGNLARLRMRKAVLFLIFLLLVPAGNLYCRRAQDNKVLSIAFVKICVWSLPFGIGPFASDYQFQDCGDKKHKAAKDQQRRDP